MFTHFPKHISKFPKQIIIYRSKDLLYRKLYGGFMLISLCIFLIILVPTFFFIIICPTVIILIVYHIISTIKTFKKNPVFLKVDNKGLYKGKKFIPWNHIQKYELSYDGSVSRFASYSYLVLHAPGKKTKIVLNMDISTQKLIYILKTYKQINADL